MTETHWLGSDDVLGMLEHVLGRASERKLRLFGCACVRELGYLLSERRVRAAFYVAERFADQRASSAELEQAHSDAVAGYQRLYNTCGSSVLAKVAAVHDALCRTTDARLKPERMASLVVNALLLGAGGDRAWQERARRTTAGQLRDVFGNPFRRLKINPGWLRKRGQVAAQMAHVIYEERTFDELPMLADALEDGDCPHEELVRHCREGEHGRGCWTVDALLDRN